MGALSAPEKKVLQSRKRLRIVCDRSLFSYADFVRDERLLATAERQYRSKRPRGAVIIRLARQLGLEAAPRRRLRNC